MASIAGMLGCAPESGLVGQSQPRHELAPTVVMQTALVHNAPQTAPGREAVPEHALDAIVAAHDDTASERAPSRAGVGLARIPAGAATEGARMEREAPTQPPSELLVVSPPRDLAPALANLPIQR